jgi:hypothetical protein
MPKSRLRKGRKQYRSKGDGRWSVPDPANLFLSIGQGLMTGPEKQYAAELLFANIERHPQGEPALKEAFGDSWPPATVADLITLAEQYAAAQSSTPRTSHAPSQDHPVVPTVRFPGR